jgi:hypothetical protein
MHPLPGLEKVRRSNALPIVIHGAPRASCCAPWWQTAVGKLNALRWDDTFPHHFETPLAVRAGLTTTRIWLTVAFLLVMLWVAVAVWA